MKFYGGVFVLYVYLDTCCSHFLTIIAGVDLHFRHESCRIAVVPGEAANHYTNGAGSVLGKGTSDFSSDPDHNPALTEVCTLWVHGIWWLSVAIWWRRCLECDDCLWIFGCEGTSPDGCLNEYGDFIYYLLITSTKAICALQVLLVYFCYTVWLIWWLGLFMVCLLVVVVGLFVFCFFVLFFSLRHILLFIYCAFLSLGVYNLRFLMAQCLRRASSKNNNHTTVK